MSTELLDRILRINDLFRRDMDRAFAGTGLTESRVAVLWTVNSRGAATQRDIARALDVSTKNVSLLVDALEHHGFAVRQAHPTDGRAVLVALTPKGAELMATMQREHAELGADLLSAVAPADREALERGISAITDRLAKLVQAAAGNA